MKKARKILLIITIAVTALLDLIFGIVNYNDRAIWFEGLAAMLANMFLIPPFLGFLLGVYYGLDELTLKSVVRAAITSAVALTANGFITGVIYVLTSSDFKLNLEALLLFPFWSLIVGICAAAAGLLIAFGMVCLVKYIRKGGRGSDEA